MSETQARPAPATKDKRKERDDNYSVVVDSLANVLPGIPAPPGKSLMTFDQLQARIGLVPKKDRFGGLIKRSP